MKQILVSIVFLAASAAAHAQNRNSNSGPLTVDNTERLEQMVREWSIEHASSPWQRQIVERRAADQQRAEFAGKMNRFALLWNKLIHSYIQNGTFNVKEARELSKAFRDLQSTGWPK